MGKGETPSQEGSAFSYHEPGCRKVFKAQSHHVALIREEIERSIAKEMETGFSKSKNASRSLFRGSRILECRVNVSTLPPVRVAYTVSGETVTVVFLSTDIQKSEFTKALDRFLSL